MTRRTRHVLPSDAPPRDDDSEAPPLPPRWQPFEEARALARSLGFKRTGEGVAWAKTPARPRDIPSKPNLIYREEFDGYPNWLGCAPPPSRPLGFKEARAYVHTLDLPTPRAWSEYAWSHSLPRGIPSDPQRVYPRAFLGLWDWIGVSPPWVRRRKSARAAASAGVSRGGSEGAEVVRGAEPPRAGPGRPRKPRPPFEEARAFVRTLGLRTTKEWRKWAASRDRPRDIPKDPYEAYGQAYLGMRDWLGVSYRAFAEARAYARTLGLRTTAEWRRWAASPARPPDIPRHPSGTYGVAFLGIRDWLGVPSRPPWRPFPEARSFVHGLGLHRGVEWAAYARSPSCPPDIPGHPRDAYGDSYRGMRDWLGTTLFDFAAARAFVHALGFTSARQWTAFARSTRRPRQIPRDPRGAYGGEYRGLADWLGLSGVLSRGVGRPPVRRVDSIPKGDARRA